MEKPFIHPRVLKHAQKQVAKIAYGMMLQAAKAHGMPSMATDLTVHDKAYVLANPTAAFVWLLYDHGTHIVRVRNDKEKPGRVAAEMVRKVTNNFPCKLFIVDPEIRGMHPIVRLVSVEEAVDFARGEDGEE